MKTTKRLIVLSILAAAGLGACSERGGRPGPEGTGPGGRDPHASVALIFSPNGEPLNGGRLGQPSCELAMDDWFDRNDSNHDGRLDRDEFLADARAQFVRMDLDRLGYLTTDVLARYRNPFRQGSGPLNAPDPVMSADRDLNFTVTRDEFLRQADEVFARLDAGRKGAIVRADLAAVCARQAKSGGRRPSSAGPGNDPGGPGGRPGGGMP